MNENNRTLSEQSPLINDVYISSIKKEKNPKMIFVVGGVFTGIGKGTISSSILHILQLNGREDIAYLKLDPFLSTNIALRNIYLDSELFIDSAGQKYDVDYGTVYREF